MRCPKCQGEMQEGFTLDKAGQSINYVGEWAEGVPPEPSFWTGLKLGDRLRLKIATYRCDRCGFLESYAPKPSS